MSSVREFAARIANLERGVTALSASPQLGHSSLDDENVNVYDRDGNLKATVGHQHDGTYTSAELDGPIPPVPGVPSVEGGQGSLTVAWDGRYEDDVRAPLDFRLVEVYAAAGPFTDRADAALLGHFSNEAGGELTVARPVGTWHVGLVTKAESGRRSAVSGLAAASVTSVVDQALIDELEGMLDGLGDDLGELVTTIIPGLKDTINEITGVTLPALDDELGQAKSDILDAFGAASDAAAAAFNAQQVADTAAQSAAEAVGMISGMGSVLFQDEQPGPEDENDSTLWIDTTDGLNVSKRWDGSSWVVVRDPEIVEAVNKAIAAQQAADDARQAADDALALAGTAEGNAQLAIVAAAGAQSSADGVAKNLFSTGNPSGTAPYGSIWFKVNGSGQVVGQWQQTATGIGSTWTVRAVRSEVIANLDVGKLTAGTAAIGSLVAQKIAVAVATVIELHADQITAGTIDTERLNAVAIAAAVGTFLELRADQITASGAGFDVAVINQLFADMFVAHKITAEHADLRSFAADEGFVGEMRAGILTVGSVPSEALAIGVDELLPDPMWERGMTELPGGPFTWSGLHRQRGQARTLRVSDVGLAANDRAYIMAAMQATPQERYALHMRMLRTAESSHALAFGLEVTDENGVKVTDLFVSLDPFQEEPPPEDDPEPGDEPTGYPVGQYFTVESVVAVPANGFKVRPWVGVRPGDTVSAGDWYVSSLSLRSVQTTTSATGWVSQLTPNGLEVLTPEGKNAIQLGVFDTLGLTLYRMVTERDEETGDPILDEEGQEVVSELPAVSITDDGYVGADEVAANESFTYRGDELEDLLTSSANSRGVVAYVSFGSQRGPYAARTGIGYVRFMGVPGRQYVVMQTADVRNTTGKGVLVSVLYNTGTGDNFTTPHVSNSVLGELRLSSNKYRDTWNVKGTGSMRLRLDPDDDREEVPVTLSVMVQGLDSSAGEVSWFDGNMIVLDGGEFEEVDAGYSLLGATGAGPPGSTPSPTPTPIPPAKKRYVKTYTRRWHRTWQGNGQYPNAAQDALYQGYTKYYPAGGKYRSQIGVSSMTSDLSGATIKKVRIRMKLSHSFRNTGATLVIGTHSNWDRPTSFRNQTNDIMRAHFAKGQTRWLTLPSSTWAGWKNGSRRGLSFWVNSTSTAYYAKVQPSSVRIEVTYEK